MNIRVFEAFAGYGSQAIAARRLHDDFSNEIQFEFIGISEIEPNAIKAYQAINGNIQNYGDISKIDWAKVPDFDLLTYSFPCTDISNAGKQAGFSEGSKTRSSLLWECEKAIRHKRPTYLLMENVKALIQKKFLPDFQQWIKLLENYGYANFYQVLNAKNYGVPQNRERVFMISILNCDKPYNFPKPSNSGKCIKHILEPYGTVEESFYFNPEQLLRIVDNCEKKPDRNIREGISIHPLNRRLEFQGYKSIRTETAPCLTAHDAKSGEPVLWQRLCLYDNNAQAGRIYDIEGISPCVDACGGGNRMPKILEPVTTRQSLIRSKFLQNGNIRFYRNDSSKSGVSEMQIINSSNISPTITTSHIVKIMEPVAVALRGRNPINPSDRSKGAPTEQRFEFGMNVANCITTVQKDSMIAEPIGLSLTNLPDNTVLQDEKGKGYIWKEGGLWRIRRLIPIEVGRLMDLTDEDINKMINASISKTGLYRLFGNSIVVACLYHILRTLFIADQPENKVSISLSLFDL